MKNLYKKTIYWMSPILTAVILIGVFAILWLMTDEETLRNDPGPRLPDEVSNLFLLIFLGICSVIGYITGILYRVFKYHSGVLIGMILLFLGIEIFLYIIPNLSQDVPEGYSILTVILNLVELTLFWLSYPLLLCSMLYLTGKRKNNDDSVPKKE